MEKIIFIGGIGSGKTYLTEAIISQNGGSANKSPLMDLPNIGL